MLDKQYNNDIIIIFHLLLYMAEMLSSLIDRERRPIRIEFLTLKAKLTHTPGAPMGHPKQPFPFLPGSWIRATPQVHGPTDYGWRRVMPACVLARERIQEGGKKSTCLSNQVPSLPITIFLACG